jgi:hypothetical protein
MADHYGRPATLAETKNAEDFQNQLDMNIGITKLTPEQWTNQAVLKCIATIGQPEFFASVLMLESVAWSKLKNNADYQQALKDIPAEIKKTVVGQYSQDLLMAQQMEAIMKFRSIVSVLAAMGEEPHLLGIKYLDSLVTPKEAETTNQPHDKLGRFASSSPATSELGVDNEPSPSAAEVV